MPSRPVAPLTISAIEIARSRTQQALVGARERGDVRQAQELAALLRENRNRHLVGDGPTPQTLVYGKLSNRFDINKLLSFAEQAALQQITDVVEAVTVGLRAQGMRWELGRVDCAGSGDIGERLAQRYADKFLPWSRWMADPTSVFVSCPWCGLLRTAAWQGSTCPCGSQRLRTDTPHLALTLSICVYGAGVEQASVFYRMRRERALRLLRFGLARYNDFA